VLKVKLRVSGDEDVIRGVLRKIPRLKVSSFTKAGEREYLVNFRILRENSDLIATANELLVKEGVKVLRIEEQMPSLEEAFISLIGDENAKATSQ